MNLEKTINSLKERGFTVSYFPTAAEATAYLDHSIDGKTIGVGGSVTLRDMGIYESLSKHNEFFWAWYPKDGSSMKEMHTAAATADVYLSSVNAISETGELINIDGTGNRIASTVYGHEKIYLVSGINKISPDFQSALWRARNIASPKNAQRLHKNTPCAIKGDKCYNCKSPDRICNALTVLWAPMHGMETEVVLIGEELGF